MADWVSTRWGAYLVQSKLKTRVQKILWFKPGGGVSLQTHSGRFEDWTCIAGRGSLWLGRLNHDGEQEFDQSGLPVFGSKINLVLGMSAKIALGQAHMAASHKDSVLVIDETWYAKEEGLLSEEDIKRYGDPFSDESDALWQTSWTS